LDGERLIRLSGGICLGLVAIALTLWISLLRFEQPSLSSDLLAIVLGIWALGWALGPVVFGGEDTTLLPEHFRSLPLTPRQLATGLLGASFVSVPAAVSLLAFSSLFVYAMGLGSVPAIVALPVIAVQLVFVVLLSRVASSLLRTFIRSQLSAALGSLITSALAAFTVSGWWLFVAIPDLVALGLSPAASTVIHAVPSSWGLVAIDAAHAAQWPLAIGAVLGLMGVIFLLWWAWARLLEHRLTTKRTHGRTGQTHTAHTLSMVTSPIGAVVRKELLTWRRDFTRSGHIYFALFFSVFVCLYPVTAGVLLTLPWIGAIFALIAAGTMANLYGADGTALWMTLTTPNAARDDVRGRQLAWLLIVAPVALIITLLMIVLTDSYWALPGALTLVIAALGTGAGLLVANSVERLVPMTDPHKRGDDLFEHGISWWQFMSLVIATVFLVAPASSLVVLGMYLGLEWMQWIGVPAGLASGILYYWWFGRLAYRRLEARGPELLSVMRNGLAAAEPKHVTAAPPDEKAPSQTELMLGKIIPLVLFGLVLLIAQAIVPLILLAVHSDVRLWFLALYLPDEWRMLTIAAFAIAGGSLIGAAVSLLKRHRN
jgi:ABC-2 type transport system permease protein